MNIPVAAGVGGSEPLVIGTAMKLVLYYWEAELSEEIHYEGGPGILNSWQGAQKTFGFSQQAFVPVYILYLIPFHFFHLLTCSYLKSWVKESRTLSEPKWTNKKRADCDNLLCHAGDLREDSLKASRGFAWSLHILLPYMRDKRSIQAGSEDGTLGCHKILSPGKVLNQITEKQWEEDFALSYQK